MRIKIGILVFLFAFFGIAKAEWMWHEEFPWVYSSSENEWSFWYSSGDYMFWDDSEKTWTSTHPQSKGKWLWHGKFPWVYSHEKENWVYWQPGVGNLIQWKSNQDKWLTYRKETTQGWIHDLKNDPFVHPSIFAGYFSSWWLDSNSSLVDNTNFFKITVEERSKVVQIAAVDSHVLYVKENGALLGMGGNLNSQLGRSSESLSDTDSPIVIVESNVTYAAVGRDYCSFFIKTDGSLWAMGGNQHGQLGDDSNITRTTPVLICKEGVRQVSSDGSSTLFLKDDGSLWGMGLIDWQDNIHTKTPFEIVDKNVTFLTGGGYFLKNDATLWKASSDYYRIIPDLNLSSSKPTKLINSKVSKISSFADGRDLFFTDENKSLYEFDWRNVGGASVVDTNKTGVDQIANGGHLLMYLDQNGSLWHLYGDAGGVDKLISDDVKR